MLLTCWSAHSRVERQSRCVTYLWMWMWLGYDVSAVDADSGQAGVLETSLTDVVDTVCQSDITTVCPNTLLYTAVGVDAAVSVQRAAAASRGASPLSCRLLRLMVLCLSRRRLLITATVREHGSDARLLGRAPCCHAAGVPGTWVWLSRPTAQIPLLTTSPHCPGVVFVR